MLFVSTTALSLTPTKEPQAAGQKTPSTESPVRIAMNSWTTSNLYNKTSQRMASSDHTYLSDDAMECQDEFGSDRQFLSDCADLGMSVEAITRLKNHMEEEISGVCLDYEQAFEQQAAEAKATADVTRTNNQK